MMTGKTCRKMIKQSSTHIQRAISTRRAFILDTRDRGYPVIGDGDGFPTIWRGVRRPELCRVLSDDVVGCHA